LKIFEVVRLLPVITFRTGIVMHYGSRRIYWVPWRKKWPSSTLPVLYACRLGPITLWNAVSFAAMQ